MSASYRPVFNGIHRQLRLLSMRLGEDWQIEVRPLTLTHEPPKLIHIKDSPSIPEHEPNTLALPGQLPAPVP